LQVADCRFKNPLRERFAIKKSPPGRRGVGIIMTYIRIMWFIDNISR
jgi:hypothetical protein